jgi:predicted MPP superfamily phosphohydrolase
MPGRSLLDPVDLTHPDVPDALVGLRIAHLTDLHAHRTRKRHHRLAAELRQAAPDLVLHTGDFVSNGDKAEAGRAAAALLCDACQPPHGTWACLGNHDDQDMQAAVESLPIRMLFDEAARVPGLPLVLMGAGERSGRDPDFVQLAESLDQLDAAGASEGPPPLHLMLCHKPDWLASAANLGVHIMLSGHTHGGQIRLPGPGRPRPLYNSSSLPLHMTTGRLRTGQTLGITSRGLGEKTLPLRVACPPHAPLITLRRGPLTGPPTEGITCTELW